MFRDDQIGAPLKQRVFRRIWLASLLSTFGSLIQGVGATVSADVVISVIAQAAPLPTCMIAVSWDVSRS